MSNLFLKIVAALVMTCAFSGTAYAQSDGEIRTYTSKEKDEDGNLTMLHNVVVDGDGEFAGSVTMTYLDGEAVTIFTDTEQTMVVAGWKEEERGEFLGHIAAQADGKKNEEEEEE